MSSNPTLVSPWHNTQGGTSPIVANNILYYASGGALRALDPTSGVLLWSSNQTGHPLGKPDRGQQLALCNGRVRASDRVCTAYRACRAGLQRQRQTDVLLHDSASRQTVMWLMNGAARVGQADHARCDVVITHVGDFSSDDKADLVTSATA